ETLQQIFLHGLYSKEGIGVIEEWWGYKWLLEGAIFLSIHCFRLKQLLVLCGQLYLLYLRMYFHACPIDDT
ncbi:hypothetical protein J0J37_22770, partial [Vibrio vulnificus]|uniref:hypothetical protein n=1 Tax=Vibrio vulnificus TaxID=672 RepID=UPI0019D474D3